MPPSLFILIYLQSVFTCYTMGKFYVIWLAGMGKKKLRDEERRRDTTYSFFFPCMVHTYY